MICFLKSRAYAYCHSRNFIAFCISMLLWAVGNLINIVFLGAGGVKMSLYYGIWCFTEFYLCFIPVVASTWYGNYTSSGFSRNIPYLMNDRRFFASSVVFSFVLNAVCMLFIFVAGFIVYSIPNDVVVYVNDATTMIKMMYVLFLSSFCRCSFVIFITELMESRVWGSVIGMMGCAGFGMDFLVSIESGFLYMFRIKKSCFPLSSLSNYVIINNILPPFYRGETDHIVTSMCGGSVWVMTLRMCFYMALFLSMTALVNRRKDML